jgi:hypothetical protein
MNFLMKQVILRHGAPRNIISDRGTQFTSRLFKEILKRCQSKHCPTSGYHPQSNGLTEKANHTLANMISMYVSEDHKNWDDILPFVTFAYNSSVQETTGYSPYFLLYGKEPTTLLESLINYPEGEPRNYDEYIENLISLKEKTRKLVIENINQRASRMKAFYDAKHKDVKYKIGELVAMFIPTRRVGRSEKLIRQYFGPYVIKDQITPVTYKIVPLDNPKNKKPEAAHVSRLKPYFLPIQEPIDHDQEDSESEIDDMITRT